MSRRMVAAGVISAGTSALFIAGLNMPGAEATPQLVLVGLATPAGVALLWLALLDKRIDRWNTRVPWPPQPKASPRAPHPLEEVSR